MDLHAEPDDAALTADQVTVVIPVRDDRVGLAATLQGIAPAGLRTIVRDDGSGDPVAIARVVARHGAELLRADTSAGPAAARNAGLAAVTTPWVLFLDAGVVSNGGSLDELFRMAAALPEVSWWAPRVRSTTGSSLRERYEEAASPLDMGTVDSVVAPRSNLTFTPSAAVLVRAEALRSIGGFDENLRYGEDVDALWRLCAEGFHARYVASSWVQHPPRGSWRFWATQRMRYGMSSAPLAERHPGLLSPVVMSSWSAAWCSAVGLAAWSATSKRRGVRRSGVFVGLGAAAALAGSNVATLGPRLEFRAPGQRLRWSNDAARLVLRGHLGALAQLNRSVIRPWWPLALLGALLSRRVRLWVLAAVLVSAWCDPRRRRARVGPLQWVLLRTVDDAAYSAGVWLGALEQRSGAALRPDFGVRKPGVSKN